MPLNGNVTGILVMRNHKQYPLQRGSRKKLLYRFNSSKPFIHFLECILQRLDLQRFKHDRNSTKHGYKPLNGHNCATCKRAAEAISHSKPRHAPTLVRQRPMIQEIWRDVVAVEGWPHFFPWEMALRLHGLKQQRGRFYSSWCGV